MLLSDADLRKELDSGRLVLDPWDPAMLSWTPGRRDTDGPWAPHWYAAVEKSTGFGPPDAGAVELPDDARRLADRCRPYYERLAEFRLGTRPVSL